MNAPAAVVPFYFQSHEVRTIIIDNEPWFVAKDVCDILGLGNVTKALQKVPTHHHALNRIQGVDGKPRETNIVSEPGLYRLILRSDKPQAEPFMEWLTAEVLPSIRKTGIYSLPTRPVHIPLFPGKEYAAALAHTREGELLARELTVGIRISQACGMRGRRQILEEGNALAAKRCGIDPLQYFDMSLEKLFPRTAADEGPGQLIASFIADEYTLPEQLPGALEYHVPIPKPRLPLKAVYERFKLWWAERIDNRLRYLPSMKHLAKMLRENGIEVKPSGGKTWAIGLEVRA